MKELKGMETEQYSLCVYECNCGFHIGLDATYLDQVGPITLRCPSCSIAMAVSDDPDVAVCAYECPRCKYMDSYSAPQLAEIGEPFCPRCLADDDKEVEMLVA